MWATEVTSPYSEQFNSLATARGQGFRERASLRKLGSCPEARCLNRIKQQPIRSIWDNNICQMNHFTGWPDNCTASPYLEINPLVANRSGANLKGFAFGTVSWRSEVVSGPRRRQRAGQGHSLVSQILKNRHFLRSASYCLLFFFSPLAVGQQSTTQVPSAD